MRRSLFLVVVLLMLSSCTLIKIVVPPEAYSLDTAIFVLETRDYRLSDVKEIDSYGDVEMKGKVAVFETEYGPVFLYVYKGEEAKKIWKKLNGRAGFVSIRSVLDLPNMGKFSTVSNGKKIVAWWRKNWLFIVEGKNGVEEFVKHVYRVYEEMKQ
ncbi:hypothetical protein THMA_1663 [Thermotoga maritima MSB8]|uniref:Lipoprotein n=1 Tax=Thermotoga maritima (strain ATCC 43589 / DSM 3109 / JCM 10099 / NBRC 100826 / MSB8) TaxID=243274 RepID=Q9X1V7_THEMA|nr:DUF3242 domain-containing protein [Thermotoga maritima]AAD36689.1 hypothetical protein TM_1622 [Thermotoga maritima MSB8]AGL50555.1 hypothetical protein Tmari_1631 [Thermotoga maritima MSB8]AHD18481.1 hypothetical protein THEMA_06135 [Thermotoga maritima MSB8]AKE27508.1 hypothetical protein THMC_1663 [Thermotoga maritima]AKE29381.1 hypothetical protein THMA_1663 [Thermotoga maritima MSB8]